MERYVAHETTTPVERRAYVRRSGMGELETRNVCVEPDDGWEEDIRAGRRTRRARRGPVCTTSSLVNVRHAGLGNNRSHVPGLFLGVTL